MSFPSSVFCASLGGFHPFDCFVLAPLLLAGRRGTVTPLGQLMVEFPLQPGLTRALLKAAALRCEELLLPVAAMLSVENIFIRPGLYTVGGTL